MLIDNGEILIISNGMMVKKSIDIANYFKDFKGNLGNLNHYLINDDYEPEFDELYLNIEGKYFKNISSLLSDSAQGYGFGGVFTDVE